LISRYGIKENVFFLGRKSNPYQYLKKASLLALTSYYEGTPNVIIEAIANEVPIVASNCTEGIRELMSMREYQALGDSFKTEAGLITPNFFKDNINIPNNDDYTVEEQSFANALQIVLNDVTYKQNVILNKEMLLEKYDLEKVATAYLDEV
jgi:glycosyltransferase involved in cell wall biosynthesis